METRREICLAYGHISLTSLSTDQSSPSLMIFSELKQAKEQKAAGPTTITTIGGLRDSNQRQARCEFLALKRLREVRSG